MLSIIVSWRDRSELHGALPNLIDTARSCNGELIVVNFGGSKELLVSQLGNYANCTSVVQVENQRYFNKARAQNVGVPYTTNPVLFFCDCDIILESASILDLSNAVLQRKRLFATVAGVTESRTNSRKARNVVSFGYELRIKTANGRVLRIVDDEEDAETGTRHAPGLLLVRKEDFLEVNGYNSHFVGWGWEDQDMIARLVLGGGCDRITGGRAIHISHDDDARTAHYPNSDRWESRDRVFRQALRNYDDGNFYGTLSTDLLEVSTEWYAGHRL